MRFPVRRLLAIALGLAVPSFASAAGFVHPARGERLVAGDVIEIRWSPLSAAEAEEMELVLSIDGGLSFPIRVSRELSADSTNVRWRVPALPTVRARLAIRIGDGDVESETLRLVSDEFEIADDPRSPGGEPLFRTDGEWRTAEALAPKESPGPPPAAVAGSPAISSAGALEPAVTRPPDAGSCDLRPIDDAGHGPPVEPSGALPPDPSISRTPLTLRL